MEIEHVLADDRKEVPGASADQANDVAPTPAVRLGSAERSIATVELSSRLAGDTEPQRPRTTRRTP
jgi:hypothetical protein